MTHSRSLSRFIAWVLVVGFTAGPLCAQAHFSRGDSNDDGRLDLSDATFDFNRLFLGGPSPACADAADANDDGGYDISDGVFKLNFLFTGGGQPPEPFEVWDGDPTADGLGCRECLRITGDIAADTTWTKANCYTLVDGVFVKAGATLTIDAGVTVVGDNVTEGLLVVERGARLVTNGTAELPVVFTSDRPVGERGRGDWGGLIFLGRGESNVTGGEAFAEGLENQLWGGGLTPIRDDSSGTLRYTRVEFGGTEISTDNEVNSISMFGCGSGTSLEFVMCKYNLDDGFEWFGGDGTLKHGLAVGIRDDNFDYSFGWRGKGQFWVCQQRGDDADRGFEVDNHDSELGAVPLTQPTVSNVTLVGDPDTAEGSESDTGLYFRLGCGGLVSNTIVTGWKDAGFDIDDDATFANWEAGDLSVTHSIFHNNGSSGDNHCDLETDAGDGACGDGTGQLFDPNRSNIAIGRAGASPIADPYNLVAPNFRPQNDALTNFTDPTAIDPFFTAAPYCGGVPPTGADWTQAKWISYRQD